MFSTRDGDAGGYDHGRLLQRMRFGSKFGVGAQFGGVCAAAYNKARARDPGREIPTELTVNPGLRLLVRGDPPIASLYCR